jgi:putative tricarboxylic transport membrane protein
MKTQSRCTSIFWTLIGIYVAIHAYWLGLGHLHSPGPGFIFFLAAVLLIVLSVADLLITFTGTGNAAIGGEKRETPVWSGVHWQKILLVLIAVSAYVYLLNRAGFLLSTFLLMLFLFKAVEPTRWWIAILSSIVTTTLSYAIFNRWLGVPFPGGILGF